MPESKTVVIVEDDYLIAEFLEQLCREFGIEVKGKAFNAADAITIIEEVQPRYILMDIHLNGKCTGADIANDVHSKRPETKIIFITGSSASPTMERIQRNGSYKILIKPIDSEELRAAFV